MPILNYGLNGDDSDRARALLQQLLSQDDVYISEMSFSRSFSMHNELAVSLRFSDRALDRAQLAVFGRRQAPRRSRWESGVNPDYNFVDRVDVTVEDPPAAEPAPAALPPAEAPPPQAPDPVAAAWKGFGVFDPTE